jgi:negative regulator of replication initiation
MVDFNNDTTITGRSAEDILRVIIMERRYNLFDGIENYIKLRSDGNDSNQEVSVVKARLFALFLEIEETVKRNFSKEPEKIKELEKYMNSDSYDDLIKAVKMLMTVLDVVKLTRLDTKVPYESTRVSVEDKIKGHG